MARLGDWVGLGERRDGIREKGRSGHRWLGHLDGERPLSEDQTSREGQQLNAKCLCGSQVMMPSGQMDIRLESRGESWAGERTGTNPYW